MALGGYGKRMTEYSLLSTSTSKYYDGMVGPSFRMNRVCKQREEQQKYVNSFGLNIEIARGVTVFLTI